MDANFGTVSFNEFVDFLYGGVGGNQDKLEALMAL